MTKSSGGGGFSIVRIAYVPGTQPGVSKRMLAVTVSICSLSRRDETNLDDASETGEHKCVSEGCVNLCREHERLGML
jgi:hypothetical protein